MEWSRIFVIFWMVLHFLKVDTLGGGGEGGEDFSIITY